MKYLFYCHQLSHVYRWFDTIYVDSFNLSLKILICYCGSWKWVLKHYTKWNEFSCAVNNISRSRNLAQKVFQFVAPKSSRHHWPRIHSGSNVSDKCQGKNCWRKVKSGQVTISPTCLRPAFMQTGPERVKSCMIWLSFLRFWDLRA